MVMKTARVFSIALLLSCGTQFCAAGKATALIKGGASSAQGVVRTTVGLANGTLDRTSKLVTGEAGHPFVAAAALYAGYRIVGCVAKKLPAQVLSYQFPLIGGSLAGMLSLRLQSPIASTLEKRVDGLAARVQDLQTNTDAIAGRVGGLETFQAAQEEANASVTGTMEALKAVTPAGTQADS